MKTPISITEAVQRLWDIAKANPIPGLVYECQRELDSGDLPSQLLSDGFRLRWERAWGIEARIAVLSEKVGKSISLRLEVGWESTVYAPHAARVAADLHTRVADLACWMQAVIDTLPPLTPAKR